MKATIELRTRDIKTFFNLPFIGKPQHGYFILTNTNGQQHIIRAGPSNDNMLKGDLKVDYSPYDNNITGSAASDYITDKNLYRSVVLYRGDDATASRYFNKIWEYGTHINWKSPDYKLPVCDIINLNCADNNSNSFVKKATEYAGLPFKIPAGNNGDVVWMPGVKSDIRDTIIDHLIGYGGRYADLTLDQAQKLYNEYVDDRKGIASKFAGMFKVADKMYSFNKKSPEILDLYSNYEEWQIDTLQSNSDKIEAKRIELQDLANSECKCKSENDPIPPCGPSTPGARETHVDIEVHKYMKVCPPNYRGYCAPNTHTVRTFHWVCDIKVDCSNIKEKYQNQLEEYSKRINDNYLNERSNRASNMNSEINNLIGTIDKEQAAKDIINLYNDFIADMNIELNILKNGICDNYNIQHETFA